MNQAISGTPIQAAMSCHTAINSLGETLFTVTKKWISDEMAKCLTFMRNEPSCFIIELSQGMRQSTSSRTYHIKLLIFLAAGIALFSAFEKNE